MQEVKSAWYNYFKRVRDFERKYNTNDPDLKRFRKEIVAVNTPEATRTVASASNNNEVLYEVRSPLIEEDTDETTPANLYAIKNKPRTFQSTTASTINAVPLAPTPSNIPPLAEIGNIGPGFSYREPDVDINNNVRVFPKQIEDFLQKNAPEPPAPSYSYVQTRPPPFNRNDNVINLVGGNEDEDDLDDNDYQGDEEFDADSELVAKYQKILTPLFKYTTRRESA